MKKNESVIVLLYPVSKYDRRKDAEFIENNCYTIDELKTLIPVDVLKLTLTDFMDKCNNEDISLDSYWLSYIRIDKYDIKNWRY